MFVDARSVDDGHEFEADACVVGAGAAGIPLARALEADGLDVCLVESGGFEREAATQALYQGTVTGDAYAPLHLARLRFLGGTTNHWGGACQPLDAFELEPRPWIEHSGWPMAREDLDPFYEAARPLLGLPEPHYRFDAAEAGVADDAPLLAAGAADFPTVVWRNTQPEPTRMGTLYREALAASSRLRCLHHANVTQLVVDASGRRVVRADVATLSGRRLAVRARVFVLCAGAIENARILLLSDARVEGGLGNAHGLVGRFFADHGSRALGRIHLLGPARFREESFLLREPTRYRPDVIGLASSPALRRRERLLGYAVLFFPMGTRRDPRAAADARALSALSKSAESESPSRGFQLFSVEEKSPNPESRVRLVDEVDALGLRKVGVALDTRPRDWASARRSAELLGAALARTGHARLQLYERSREVWSSLPGHQVGTTRMADDPKRGVTDRDGRVHGLPNLYVCGGSLFPTLGWQNPTLTIVALALRLGAHLADASRAGRLPPVAPRAASLD